MKTATTMNADIVFLIDVDNTLLDNDRIIADLREHVASEFGAKPASAIRRSVRLRTDAGAREAL